MRNEDRDTLRRIKQRPWVDQCRQAPNGWIYITLQDGWEWRQYPEHPSCMFINWKEAYWGSNAHAIEKNPQRVRDRTPGLAALFRSEEGGQ